MKDKHLQMYMRVAQAVAESSPSQRLKVGAVAVKNNQVIGTGYNALPTSLDGPLENKVYAKDEKPWLFDGSQLIDSGTFDWLNSVYPLFDAEGRYKLVTKLEVRHAEKNLILSLAKSTESALGSMIFCTHACCYYCALDLVDLGITHFYYKHPYRCDKGLTELRRAGILVQQID